MDHARIVTLLQPFIGEAAQQLDLSRISTYIDTLLRWNARINLTAIRDPEQIVTRHFGESLFAARHLFPLCHPVTPVLKAPEGAPTSPERRNNLTLADVGSGAGFPGIPIKLWAPQLELTLIESNQKKATFLREIARALRLTDINIQTARAETLHAQFDAVTLRAVERFDSILPVAASLVAPNGRLALLIGTGQVTQARTLLSTFEADDPLPIPQSSSRTLLICRQAQ